MTHQGALGVVFTRLTDLTHAHGMAAMKVVVFIYQSALLIGLYICPTASKWDLCSLVPKLEGFPHHPTFTVSRMVADIPSSLLRFSALNEPNQ
nr:RuvB-like 2 [Tanacetum cinerariifolium]